MDLHVPAPSSSDGLYELAEPSPPAVGPSEAPPTEAAPAPITTELPAAAELRRAGGETSD